MNLTEMKAKPINELVEIAENLGIEDVGSKLEDNENHDFLCLQVLQR